VDEVYQKEENSMLSKKMEEALNDQINAEMYSSYLYLSMSSYFSGKRFPGMAHWMREQAKEELDHAMRIYDYVIESGGNIKLSDIVATNNGWKDPHAVFEQVYLHEQKVTGLIHKLVTLALEKKDLATYNFLQWFVEEQVEEEDHSRTILDKAKLVGNDGPGLFMLDRDLGQRGKK